MGKIMDKYVCVWVHTQSLSCVQFFASPMDCSPPGSSARGVFQERMLESVDNSYSRGSSRPRD